MGMVHYSEESSPSKEALLKSSLSQMKTLFCKDIDSHLRKIKSPSPKKGQEEDHTQERPSPPLAQPSSRCPLQDSPQMASSPPVGGSNSKRRSLKSKGKENHALKSCSSSRAKRKRRRLLREAPSAALPFLESSSSSRPLVEDKKRVGKRGRKTKRSRRGGEQMISSESQSFPPIKAFRKSPIKFDSSRLRSHDEDDSVGSSKARKRAVKKKLDLESTPFVPVNRRANIVEGDYLSHGRQYYHVRTNGVIAHGEPESEESYQWLPDLMVRQIDDFLDLNAGEKELIKMWNEFIISQPAYGSEMLASRLRGFVEDKGTLIASRGLYKNFILHLTNLYEHEVLEQIVFLQLILQLQGVMANMEVKPWLQSWKEQPIKKRLVPAPPPPPPGPSSAPHRPIHTAFKTKKKRQKPKPGHKSRRRASLRRGQSGVMKMTSDVSVKFWGAGDYTSIKDAIPPLPSSLKRKFESDPKDLRSLLEFKRRKISLNGHFHTNSSCTEVT